MYSVFIYCTLICKLCVYCTMCCVAQKGARVVAKAAALDKGVRGRNAHGDKAEDKEIKALAKQMRQVI